jgi:hypothetical protein
MFLRDPICLAMGAVNFTDAGPVRSGTSRDPAALTSLFGADAVDVGGLGLYFESIHTPRRGKSHTLADALHAWARRATGGCKQTAQPRKPQQAPTISSQSALDFANELNSRLAHVSQFTVYPASPLHADRSALCCPRYRKALSTALLGFVLTAPALTGEGSLRAALPKIDVDFSAAHLRTSLVPADDLRVVLVLKHGLRGATALFGRFSAKASVRNVATMTAGVRN